MREAVEYVANQQPPTAAPAGLANDLPLILSLAVRFHESVLALKKHPHGSRTYVIRDEWDCQHLFRSILAVYFRDVRTEEWNPSVAGSSSRCEFFLKESGIMVELKYVRGPNDQKKMKTQLLTDFADYGANNEVECVFALVYDPIINCPRQCNCKWIFPGPRKGSQM